MEESDGVFWEEWRTFRREVTWVARVVLPGFQ